MVHRRFGSAWIVARAVALAVLVAFSVSRPVSAGTVTYITPTNAYNSSATWQTTVNGTYTENFGIAFTTGGSGPFDIDWINLDLNSSGQTATSGSLTVALRNTNNSTAYSAVAGATEYAKDTINFSMPGAMATYFSLNLTAAQLPNITSFALQSNTSYALILYAPSVNIAMGRTTGFAQDTTNAQYTVTNGFTMLNTFRSNFKYSNNPTSFPTLAISFGATTSSAAVPEPSMLGFAAVVVGGGLLRRFRRSCRRA